MNATKKKNKKIENNYVYPIIIGMLAITMLGLGLLFLQQFMDPESVTNLNRNSGLISCDTFTNELGYELDQYKLDFFSTTSLQRTENWKEDKGKLVLWSFFVKNVKRNLLGDYIVTGSIIPANQYYQRPSTDVTFKFDYKYRNDLLQLNVGDRITATGILDSFSSYSQSFTVKDGRLCKR